MLCATTFSTLWSLQSPPWIPRRSILFLSLDNATARVCRWRLSIVESTVFERTHESSSQPHQSPFCGSRAAHSYPQRLEAAEGKKQRRGDQGEKTHIVFQTLASEGTLCGWTTLRRNRQRVLRPIGIEGQRDCDLERLRYWEVCGAFEKSVEASEQSCLRKIVPPLGCGVARDCTAIDADSRPLHQPALL